MQENIAFGLLRDRVPSAEIEKRVKQIAEMLEITDLLERFPPSISGGAQQRVSLARALIRNAAIYLLDEPMSQLEPQLRALLRARIKDYLISHKMTTVVVTHDQTEAIALADRIAVMEKGVLQQFATPHDLQERPANLFVASFIGEPPMNLFPAMVQGGEIAVLNERQEVAFHVPLDASERTAELGEGKRIMVGVRPHRVHLAPTGQVKGATLVGEVTSKSLARRPQPSGLPGARLHRRRRRRTRHAGRPSALRCLLSSRSRPCASSTPAVERRSSTTWSRWRRSSPETPNDGPTLRVATTP